MSKGIIYRIQSCKVFAICIIMLMVLSCTNSNENKIRGSWYITDIHYDREKEQLGLEEAVANSIVSSDFRPTIIEVSKNKLILKTQDANNDTLDYKVTKTSNTNYTLSTAIGDANFKITKEGTAELEIAGAKYSLARNN